MAFPLNYYLRFPSNYFARQKLLSRNANVDLSRSFLFVHVPKCAGTSIYTALGFKNSYHQTASHFQTVLGQNKFEKLFVFAFTRHPIDRFLSLYHYARLKNSYYHSSENPQGARGGMHCDYETLKDASADDCVRLLLNGELKHNKRALVWQPQAEWIYGKNGEQLVDFVGRYERLNEDFRTVCDHIGLGDVSLPRINQSRSPHQNTPLSEESFRLLRSYYQRDFDLFHYT